MAQRDRLTNNSDETDIASLMSGDHIFSIPYFQRAYKWTPPRLRQLNDDILNLVDESSDFHFLGAVIVHGRRTNPSAPKVYDVIDGQQRITTIFLYVCAVVKTLSNNGEYAEAAALFLKYLVINRDTRPISNFKLHSCKDDRSQLNQVFLDLLSDEKFKEQLGGFKLNLLPKSGADSGPMRTNYQSLVRFLKDELEKQGGIDRLRGIYAALLEQMSVVQIDVWDPTNGPKIFDSLNSRQEPMTIGDLIRNEIFARVASEHPDVIERVDTDHWQPFYKKFEQNGRNYFESYFFPYGLVRRPNLKKSEVYSSLKKEWDGVKDPERIIKQLAEYQDAFLDLESGSNLCNHPKNVAHRFRRLHDAQPPSSTYPFLMQLSNAAAKKEIGEGDVIEVLAVIECFLVRRAACGYEPTGLHSVFKRLWTDCDGDLTAGRVIKELSKHKTVVWPGEEEFRAAIESRDLYGVGVTPFIVREYDRSLNGDSPTNIPWLEHILPQKPDPAWLKFFSPAEQGAMKHRLANLLPLSSQMNISLSNKPYEIKREHYMADSMFKSTRQFANEVEHWTPEALRARASELGAWSVTRWPYNRAD